MSDDDDRIESAPEGSVCAEHPDRPALVTCPRCGSHCCIVCWQRTLERCHECLLRDPMPGVPWVEDGKGFGARFLGTLRGALSPTSSAPAFIRGEWTRGLSFLLLTAFPIGLLSGVIPFTHRLGFGPAWSVTTIADPSGTELAIDVAQAIGLGLLLAVVKLALLAVPFVSLTAAYGVEMKSQPARQVMMYRAWLLVLAAHTGLLFWLVTWGMPPGEPSGAMQTVREVISLTPLMILLWSMTATARMMRIGPIAATVTVIVPFILLFLVEPLVIEMLAPWLPDPEAIRQAITDTSSPGVQ